MTLENIENLLTEKDVAEKEAAKIKQRVNLFFSKGKPSVKAVFNKYQIYINSFTTLSKITLLEKLFGEMPEAKTDEGIEMMRGLLKGLVELKEYNKTYTTRVDNYNLGILLNEHRLNSFISSVKNKYLV